MKTNLLSIFTLFLFLNLLNCGKPNLDKFANRYNPDKAAQDCNKHAWRSCYEVKGKKCISWGWTIIPIGCAVVYDKCNYLGTASIICGNLKKLVKMNKKISSIKLGPNTNIELFDQKKLKGQNVLVKYNEPCLINHNFNSKAQSLRILKNSI